MAEFLIWNHFILFFLLCYWAPLHFSAKEKEVSFHLGQGGAWEPTQNRVGLSATACSGHAWWWTEDVTSKLPFGFSWAGDMLWGLRQTHSLDQRSGHIGELYAWTRVLGVSLAVDSLVAMAGDNYFITRAVYGFHFFNAIYGRLHILFCWWSQEVILGWCFLTICYIPGSVLRA